MTLEEALRKLTGYENLELYDNHSYLDMWEEWYQGKVEKFHNYKVYNGRRHIPFQRYTLAMAKRVCEDWANLLINEKTDITLDNELGQKVLERILERNHFWRKANIGVEKSFALGMGALVVSVEDFDTDINGNLAGTSAYVKTSFMNAKKCIPITIEDDTITECAFVNVSSNKTYISLHLKDENGVYKIHNVSATGIDDDIHWTADDYYIFDTKSKEPWFAFIYPNIANNIDINSCLGISVFANYIDILKEIDLIYDSLQNEFALGKKRIFVNAKQTNYSSSTGEEFETFDSNDVAFYVFPEADDESNVFIQSDTQSLRVTEHTEALQQQLNYLSYACGFGTNHYKFDSSGLSTATQVVSENSDLFRNIKKHEIVVEEALVTIVKAIIYASNTFTADKIGEVSDIQIKFDDSIIEDKQSEQSNDRLDVSMGAMSLAEYRSKWFNEDLETAERKIAEMQSTTIKDTYEPNFEEGREQPEDGANGAESAN